MPLVVSDTSEAFGVRHPIRVLNTCDEPSDTCSRPSPAHSVHPPAQEARIPYEPGQLTVRERFCAPPNASLSPRGLVRPLTLIAVLVTAPLTACVARAQQAKPEFTVQG